jgi:hypothetical protein
MEECATHLDRLVSNRMIAVGGACSGNSGVRMEEASFAVRGAILSNPPQQCCRLACRH